MKPLLAIVSVLAVSLPAHALTVTQWTFNSAVPDNSTSTGTTSPAFGAGTASLLGGVTSPGFNSGVGSSDPAPGDNSGWQTTNYAVQGAGDKTRGVQFLVSTVGYQGISISYDLRHSNTSSRYEAVQYTLNGSTWIDAATFDGNAGDTWFNGRTVDLSSVAGADNNANFGFRVLATFAPSTSQYAVSNPSSTYGASGTWRFDMVTVSAVPEPATGLLLAGGVLAVGAAARRRRT